MSRSMFLYTPVQLCYLRWCISGPCDLKEAIEKVKCFKASEVGTKWLVSGHRANSRPFEGATLSVPHASFKNIIY